MVIVVGSWWGLKPECVISAASYHSFHKEEHLCSPVSNPASSTGPTCPIHSASAACGVYTGLLQQFWSLHLFPPDHCDRIAVQSFLHLLSEHQGGEFQMSATKSKVTLGTGSSSWCLAVVAIESKKCHQCLLTGKVTPSSTTKEGIHFTGFFQFSASSCTDISTLTEQQALSRISRENRGDKSLKRRKGGVGNAWGCLVFSLKYMFQVKTCNLLFKFTSLRKSRNGLRLTVFLLCMISENQI